MFKDVILTLVVLLRVVVPMFRGGDPSALPPQTDRLLVLASRIAHMDIHVQLGPNHMR
jgi:hypothetical protein